jgi:hypothetical protein
MQEASPKDDPAVSPKRTLARRGWGKALAHPLILLLVGAAISAFVVPFWSQRSQDHQRALDVQTTLVSDLAGASTEFLTKLSAAGFETKVRQKPAPSVAPAWERWQVKRAVIGAKLTAYYGETDLPGQLDNLATAIGSLYAVNEALAQLGDKYDTSIEQATAEQRVMVENSDRFSRSVGQRFSFPGDFLQACAEARGLRDALVRAVLDKSPRI